MTKPREPRPEPSTGTGYDSYLVPRSKTPEKQALYDLLIHMGWRFDAHHMQWYTPEGDTFQAHGRLEWAPDHTWARIQPSNSDYVSWPEGQQTFSMKREAPILEFEGDGKGTWLVCTHSS